MRLPHDPTEAGGHAPRGGGDARAPSASLRFVNLAEIASGDTARIDLCRVTDPPAMHGRLVAVKRLHPHLLEDRELASMFFDEVWMTASLVHPNVVEVAGWGEDAEGPYLAVELLEGVSLARLTKTVFDTGEIFGERMVVFVGSQICRGLSAAHELRGPGGDLLGLVHRDLTPGNVLIGFEGRVKIADFGLAKAKQRITRTVTGLLKGRPQYMAPEQARGDVVDARADLFSLGVLLFELFAGRRPWSGGTEFEVLSSTQNEPPADLRELRPKIDRELANIVHKLLEKSPDDRFATASEVGIRLDEWLAVHGWSEGNDEALARFVRRNAMRQMRWFERAIRGELGESNKKGRARTGSLPGLSPEPTPDARVSRRERAKRVSDDPTERTGARLDVLEATPEVGAGFAAPAAADPINEEIPTLIHRDRPLTPAAGAAPGFAILEEDSDQRTTAVKGRSPAADAPLPPIGPGDDIEDPETETLPVKGPRQAAVKAAIDKARAASQLPPPRPPPRPPGAPSPPSRKVEERPAPVPSEPTVPRTPSPTGPPRVAWSLDAVTDAAARVLAAARDAEQEAARAAEEAALKAAIARRAAELAEIASQTLRGAEGGADLQHAAATMEEAERALAAARRGEVELQPAPERQETATFAGPAPFEGRAFSEPDMPTLARNPHASFSGEAGAELEHHAPSFLPPSPRTPGASSSQAPAAMSGAHAYDAVEAMRRQEELRRSVESATVMSMRLRPTIFGLQPIIAAALAIFGLLLVILLALVLFG